MIFEFPVSKFIYLVIPLGLMMGSFANVCIYRWPRNLSVLHPHRSYCPWCRRQIAWFDNIPLISYLLLKGRCRWCESTIPHRYALIEILVPILWGSILFVWLVRFPSLDPGFPLFLFFLWTLVVTTWADLDWRIVPDQATFSLIFCAMALSGFNPILSGDSFVLRLLDSLKGLIFTWILFGGGAWAGEFLFGKEILGQGDVKLLIGIGAILGWQGAVVAFLEGCLIGSMFIIVSILRRKYKRNEYIPFAPFINAGAIVTLFGWFFNPVPALRSILYWMQSQP